MAYIKQWTAPDGTTYDIKAASCTGNAATSTALLNTRTIFGQNFNGTQNVAGRCLCYGTYTATAGDYYHNGGLEVREQGLVTSSQSDFAYAPRIGFHWAGLIAASLSFHNDGIFYFRKQNGSDRATIDANLNGNASTATNADTVDGYHASSFYLKTGGEVSGIVYANRGGSSVPSFRWNKGGSYWGGIGYFGTSNENYFGPVTSTGEWVTDYTDTWTFRGKVQVLAYGANTASWGLKVNNGAIDITNYGYTLTVGNLNSSYTHFHTTCSQFYFNKKIIVDGDIARYTGTGTISGYNLNGNASSANVLNINNNMGLSNCVQYIQTSTQTARGDLPSSSWYHVLRFNHENGDTYYKRLLAFSFWGRNNVYTATAEGDGVTSAWSKFWLQGDSVTSAVWNDYAEYRESETIEPGYVLTEKGDDTLVKSTERLQHFAGVSSDTWGFAEGKTEKAQTPIAVAGRVLVYTYQPRENYKPGDCVCAAPDGTVDIMTHEEEKEWPSRIVGTVSCVPDYEEWGGGEGADRGPVKVNGRIWIKVK